jgi:probable HAF family extracellular repeat protein
MVVAALAASAALAQPGAPAAAKRSVAAVTAPPTYKVEYIPRPAGQTGPLVAQGINENGDLTGWTTGSPHRGWVFTKGGGTTLLANLPGNANGFAWELNDVGQVAGSSGFESGEPPEHAVRWTGGVPLGLGTLGTDSRAYSVNNLGHAVGMSYVNGQAHGFFWSDTSGMVDVAPSRPFTTAYDLNESDQVTGRAGNGHAFRWQAGSYTDLPPPAPFTYSAGFAINEKGQIAGSVKTGTGGSEQFARYTDGVGWEVLGGLGQSNALWGINDHGDGVGQGKSPEFDVGFVYFDGSGLFQLNDLQATPGEWFITDARDINNAGQIAAYARAQDGSGREGAVLLTPVGSGPTMHVSALTLKLKLSRRGAVASVTTTVKDGSAQPVPGASVTGAWSLNTVPAGESSAQTDRKGVARAKKSFAGAKSGDTIRFCVTNIAKAGYSYDPAANAKTCDEARVP